MRKLLIALPLALAAVLALGAVSAYAAGPAPGWELVGYLSPTDPTPGTTATLQLELYDIGAQSNQAPVTVTDELPAGVVATGGAGCTGTTVVTCEVERVVVGAPVSLRIPVKVESSVVAGSEAVNKATAGGGGASSVASVDTPVRFGPAQPTAQPAFSLFDGWYSNLEGAADAQAGSHPYELTLAMGFDNDGTGPVGGEPRDLALNLPSGLLIDVNAAPQCERPALDAEACPISSVVGEDTVQAAGQKAVKALVYNMVPPPGVPAELAFNAYSTHTLIDASLRTGTDDGLTLHVGKLPQQRVIYDSLTLWGAPAEESHNSSRGGRPNALLTSFVTLPASCGFQPTFGATILDTWQSPLATASSQFAAHDNQQTPSVLGGCDRLGFGPTVTAVPNTGKADKPAEVTVNLVEPQEGLSAPEVFMLSAFKNASAVLPQGMALNPGMATSLQPCEPSVDGVGSTAAPSCPSAAKLGEAEIETPLLRNPLKGDIYLLPSNPPTLQLLVAASGEGVNLKLPATLQLNEATGQPTLSLAEAPELAISDLKLALSGGAQATLLTPPTCGVYQTDAEFVPSTAPSVEDVLSTSGFTVNEGPEGQACAPLSFAPQVTVGASTDQAGGLANVSVLIERGDGQQRISGFSVKLAAGLLGMLGRVPLCPEPQAAAGTCSVGSQIGHVVLGAGAGPYPLYLPQPGAASSTVYLTGPYEGAPFGLSIVLPLHTGPFELGTKVVRAKVEVDPHTGQLTFATGAWPQVVAGVPLDLRTIDMVLDRPGFMFNATDCEPQTVSGAVTSVEGASSTIATRYELGSCQALKFEPGLVLSTAGKTTKASGASLGVKLVYPAQTLAANEAESQANVRQLTLHLPKQLALRSGAAGRACAAGTFQADPAACPPASVVGSADAASPVFQGSLSGPVYLVASPGKPLPSLVGVLQGGGITLDLPGSLASAKGVVTGTLEAPDVPVTNLEFVLPQGPNSLLAASGSLCAGKPAVSTELVGQNNAPLDRSVKLAVSGCPKSKTNKKTKKKKKKAKKKQKATRKLRGKSAAHDRAGDKRGSGKHGKRGGK